MTRPSVKGAALLPVINHLRKQVEKGKLCREDLGAPLEQGDFDLIEGTMVPTLWYPIAIQDRMLRAVRDLEGAGNDEYLADFAYGTAAAILNNGPYARMVESAESFGDRAGVALVKMAELIFNFSQWEYEGEDLKEFRVHVTEASELPETARHSAAGFIRFLASLMAGTSVRVTSERPTPDRIVFTGSTR